MRVLHVVHGLAHGGLERGVVNLCNNLPYPDIEQAVCCLDLRGALADQVHSRVDIFELNRTRHDLRLPFRLAGLIRRWRPDVIHARNWTAWTDAVAAHRLAGGKSALVWSFHGFPHATGMPLRRRLASRLLSAMTPELAAVCHDSALRVAREIGISPERFAVLYNGVDCDKFKPAEDKAAWRTAAGLHGETVVAVTVASLTPIKNHARLLDTVAELPEQTRSKLKLFLLGDGPLRADVEGAIARLSLADTVVMPGVTDRVSDYLKHADLFILPSRLEGMSNAILEAMACGLPAIAHRVGGNPELIVDGVTGFTCEIERPEQLAEAIRCLIEDPELRQRAGLAARERALDVFSLDTMMRKYSAFYRDVAKRHGLGCRHV